MRTAASEPLVLSPADPDFEIRPARLSDFSAIDHLQKQLRYWVGWVRKPIMLDRLASSSYLLLSLRGQPAGYVYFTKGIRSPMRIVQNAVSDELWRSGYGSCLAAAAARLASASPFRSLCLSVLDGFFANGFWRSLGFKPVSVRPGGRSRQRMLIDYHLNPTRTSDLAATIKSTFRIQTTAFQEDLPWSL